MKRGRKVAVCYDGKWSRKRAGVVVATRGGDHIQVAFTPPGKEHTVTFWAKKISRRPSRFGGWCDVDCCCPWYSVSKWKD